MKKYKKKELKLEAASVSQNFDPEAYIYPLQNRWTFDTDKPHNSHRDQDFKILKNGSASSSVSYLFIFVKLEFFFIKDAYNSVDLLHVIHCFLFIFKIKECFIRVSFVGKFLKEIV